VGGRLPTARPRPSSSGRSQNLQHLPACLPPHFQSLAVEFMPESRQRPMPMARDRRGGLPFHCPPPSVPSAQPPALLPSAASSAMPSLLKLVSPPVHPCRLSPTVPPPSQPTGVFVLLLPEFSSVPWSVVVVRHAITEEVEGERRQAEERYCERQSMFALSRW